MYILYKVKLMGEAMQKIETMPFCSLSEEETFLVSMLNDSCVFVNCNQS